MYADWHAQRLAALRVPAGLASAPSRNDDAAASSDAPGAPGAPSPRIPDALPAFSLNDLSGHATPISEFAGKSLVINFWATWCAPCRREIPLLNALATQWASHDVAVVGVAVDHRDKVLQFRDQFKIGYPLLIGEQEALDVAASFGMVSPAFPFTVFTDRRGEVVALFVGELHRPQAALIMSAVQDLNRGTVRLGQARQQIAQGLDALAEKT
jgi:thiol-disulfide isomerase/thioredoxin